MKCFVIAIFVVLLGSVNICSQSPNVALTKEQKERAEAALLWEQMIEVKGGRKRLHSVRNVLVTQGKVTPETAYVRFYVYPNKFWEWNKDKDFYDAMFLTMVNFDLRTIAVVTDEGVIKFRTDLSHEQFDAYKSTYLMEATRLLLETKWLQPNPIRVTTQKLFNKRVDVIETHVPKLKGHPSCRIDFYIEPETLEVLGHIEYREGSNKDHFHTLYGAYKDIEGIKVPISYQRASGRFPKKKNLKNFTKMEIRLNVEYDKGLFDRLPRIKDGPHGWKPKS